MRKGLLIATASIALVAGASFAQDISGKWGISGTVGGAMPAGPEFIADTDNVGLALGVGIRYGMSRHWGLALTGDDVRVYDGVQMQPLNLMLGYTLFPDKRLTPVAYLGGGVAGLGKSYDLSIMTGKAALGLEYFLSSRWSLSGLAVYHIVQAQDTTNIDDAYLGGRNEEIQAVTGNLMLTYWFGACEKKPVVEKIVEEVKVEAAPVVEEVQQEVVPAPAPVREVVAPAAPVVPEITRETKSMKLNVLFDSGKAILKSEYIPEVERLGKFLQKYPEASVSIEGHSDNTGSEQGNMKLSQNRAASIKSYLVNTMGIDASRVQAQGFGSSRPVADNATADGRAQNRRVMAEFSYTEVITK